MTLTTRRCASHAALSGFLFAVNAAGFVLHVLAILDSGSGDGWRYTIALANFIAAGMMIHACVFFLRCYVLLRTIDRALNDGDTIAAIVRELQRRLTRRE